MEREAKDRCMTWLLEHHPEAVLRAGRMKEMDSCVPLRTVLTHPKVIPDGVYRVRFKGEQESTYCVVEVTTYPDKEECDQVMKGVSMVLLEYGVVPDVISLVLAAKGKLQQEGKRELKSPSGETVLTCTWKVADLYNSHSNDLLALDMVGAVPLVPLTVLDGQPEAVFDECRRLIEEKADPAEKGNLLAIAATFVYFRFESDALANIFLKRAEEMLDTPWINNLMAAAPEATANIPFVKNLVAEGKVVTRREDARRAVLANVKARFMEEPEDIRVAIGTIDDVDRLWSLVPIAAVESLDKIRDALK